MHRDPPLSREGMLALCERALNVDLPAAELDAVFPDGEPTDPSRNRLYWDLVDGVEHVPGYLSGGVDPKSGRFTQEDPIGIAGRLNVYGFGNGDPVTYSDPYGAVVHDGCDPPGSDFRQRVVQGTALVLWGVLASRRYAPLAPAVFAHSGLPR